MNTTRSRIIAALALLTIVFPFHLAAAPCNEADHAGGGDTGNSPGPIGPPDSLGWDVGTGQCNGSFTVFSDPAFASGVGIELALRAEERRVGQVTRSAGDTYEVELGHDDNAPAALNRAWWNFQLSIASDQDIGLLDALTLQVRNDVGDNAPAAPVVDLLDVTVRAAIAARNNQPNATTEWDFLYQISQNPEFGWFTHPADDDGNNTGVFDYDEPGAWRFRLTAEESGETAAAEICIHSPGQACIYPVVGVAKEVTTLDGMLPATIQVSFDLENFGDDTLLTLSMVDDLSAVFGTHGVDWTFTSITSSPGALANPSFNGHSDTELIDAAQSLAGTSIASITVELELLTVDAAIGGNFCNQATITGSDSLGVSYSDLSVAGTNPDPGDDDDPSEQSPSCLLASSVPVTLQSFEIE